MTSVVLFVVAALSATVSEFAREQQSNASAENDDLKGMMQKRCASSIHDTTALNFEVYTEICGNSVLSSVGK